MLHHLVAVEVGADRLELLARLQLGDARLELVHPAGQRGRLALVAGGAVAAGELDQLGQQVAGVAHEAAHGGVGPAHLVGVEPQVQVHERGSRPRRRRWSTAAPSSARGSCGRPPPRGGGTTRRSSPIARVLGLPTSWNRAPTRRTEALGPGRWRTTAMVWVSTSLWRWIGSCSRRIAASSGRNSVGQAGVDQEPQAGAGVVDHDELVELVADALGRHDVEPVGHGSRRPRRARAPARGRSRR